MAQVLQNGLAYFFKGVQDCFYGFYRIFDIENESLKDKDVDTSKHLSVLAQRRAASRPPPPKKADEPRITHRIFQCCIWNGGIFWLSLLIFDMLFVPCLKWMTHTVIGGSTVYNMLWEWMGPMLACIFGAFWVLPLFIVSKVVNSLWFQDIADAAWKTKKWQQRLPKIGVLIADMLFSLVVQTLFLIQSMMASMLPIPFVGQVFSLMHLGILYSLYAFEYKWFNMGWSISRRITQIECQWPYFLGFGLPLAYLTWVPQSTMISGCIFAIFFPFLIISANEACAIKEKFDFPLHLFGLVMKASNVMFKAIKSENSKGQQQ